MSIVTRRLLLSAAGATLLPARAGQSKPPASAASSAAPQTLVFPRNEALQDSQMRYVIQLMLHALALSGHRYQARQTDMVMVQSRALIELTRPEPSIDVFWTMPTTQREQTLLPIRIPIERGLIGWRLALVRGADLPRWAEVNTLADLARYSAGQMHDWPDTPILRANGVMVQTSTRYENLFGMLASGRFDFFPRSVMEIDAEYEAYKSTGLVIEPRLLLYYPAALYYFVSAKRPQLAADLARGLEMALADGSFERLFQQQFGALIARHALARRHVLRLNNPELPAATPLQRKELWLPLPAGS